jgi:hypothetical protein
MSRLTNLLLLLAAIWVACIVLGAILHVIRVVVWIGLVATLVVVLTGMLTRRPRP